MFTGIIEKQALVLAHELQENGSRLCLASYFADLMPGESIAVNGVCLTALPNENLQLVFDLSSETLLCTNLGRLKAGDGVNLERAMKASDRLGGHYVSGHVDTCAEVLSVAADGECRFVELGGFDPKASLYLIPKGSITVNGVSLTINAVSKECIELMLVPHTLAMTNLASLHVGQKVNIEFDYLTRIVAHQLQLSGKLNDEEVT